MGVSVAVTGMLTIAIIVFRLVQIANKIDNPVASPTY